MGVPDFSYYRDHFEPPIAQPTPQFPSPSHSDPLSEEAVRKCAFTNSNAPQLDTYLVFEVVSEDEIEVNNQVRRIVGSKRVARHGRRGQAHKTLPLPPTQAFSFKCAVSMPQMADAAGEEVQTIPVHLPFSSPGLKCELQADTISRPHLLLPSPPHQSNQLHLDIDMSSVD